MLIREVMTTPVVTIAPRATVRQAIRVLHEHDVTAAPVVGDDGRMVGIVSEMDLLRGAFEADPRAFARPVRAASEPPPPRVEDVMTTEVRTARPNSDAAALADMMIETGIKSVPVLDGTALAGIVSRRDLIAVLARGDARIHDDVTALLAEYGEEQRWTVTVEDGIVTLHGRTGESTRRLADVLARTVPGVTRVTVLDTTGRP
ncbi:CBS domain-containing protein [Actinomadura sediminis]|uniref:CBS domain-containing protein n=1 Tax=Actinomadura sediminis TaxID=1038904 RepID=A0ABW3EI83_9ACTN